MLSAAFSLFLFLTSCGKKESATETPNAVQPVALPELPTNAPRDLEEYKDPNGAFVVTLPKGYVITDKTVGDMVKYIFTPTAAVPPHLATASVSPAVAPADVPVAVTNVQAPAAPPVTPVVAWPVPADTNEKPAAAAEPAQPADSRTGSEWAAARAMLKFNGSMTMGSQQVAMVNDRILREGDMISVMFHDKEFEFIVTIISSERVEYKRYLKL